MAHHFLVKTLFLSIALSILVLLIACTPTKKIPRFDQEKDSAIISEIANYFLFDEIEKLTADDYQVKLDSIKNGESKDFFGLRMAYTKTDLFSPYNRSVRDSLMVVAEYFDKSDFTYAISMLTDLHEKQFTNISAHLYSGYAFSQTGDTLKSNYHYDIYDGLLNSIYLSGDGTLPETAYIVISTSEEYEFLDWFSLRSMGQTLVYKDDYAFDILSAKDVESGEEHDIYFNVTLAIRTLGK